jgi:hypothetical protein
MSDKEEEKVESHHFLGFTIRKMRKGKRQIMCKEDFVMSTLFSTFSQTLTFLLDKINVGHTL